MTSKNLEFTVQEEEKLHSLKKQMGELMEEYLKVLFHGDEDKISHGEDEFYGMLEQLTVD